MAEKLAVLFPGIGYTCDKPLLYYSGKLASGMGYQLIRVPYTGFPEGVKGNREKMMLSAQIAMQQSEELLKDVNWAQYSDIVFLSKSIGTAVSAAYAEAHHLTVRNVLFTPVEETFRYVSGNAIAFHGTADPWAKTDAIRKACADAGIPLYLYERANHSLETGNVDQDIRNLREVMEIVRDWMNNY